jgi:microcystin-dependent protein
MSDPYIGEIKIVSFDFAPRSYAMCNGQLLPINQNQALFSILGTTYGGDGRTTFALPDLRGRVPIHWGTNAGTSVTLGQRSGEENHTLITSELPAHTHQMFASDQGASQPLPTSNYLGKYSDISPFAPNPNAAMVGNEVSNTGGSQPHNNMQPYLVLNIIIALQGIFPPRN